jgi:hypothetical protein
VQYNDRPHLIKGEIFLVFFNKISQVVCGGAYVGVASLVTVDVSNLEALWVRGYFVETVLSGFIGAARYLN